MAKELSKTKIRFTENLDINGEIFVDKGDTKNAEIYDGFFYIDFGRKGIVKVPLGESFGNFEVI